MDQIEQIKLHNQIIAIIIYNEFNKDRIEFFTPCDFSQQLGYMKHRKIPSRNIDLYKMQGKLNINENTIYKNGVFNFGGKTEMIEGTQCPYFSEEEKVRNYYISSKRRNKRTYLIKFGVREGNPSMRNVDVTGQSLGFYVWGLSK